jgi:protein TonB
MITLAALAIFTLLCLLLGLDQAWSRETSPDRNALVFEDRNRNYGAYRLREGYDKRVALSFLAALGIVSACVMALSLMVRTKTVVGTPARPSVAVDVNLDRTYDPPLLPQVAPPKASAMVPAQPKDPLVQHYVQAVDSIPEPPLLPLDTATTLVMAGNTGTGGTAGVPGGDTGTATGTGSDFGTGTTWENFQVQEVPEFPGGQQALADWIRHNLEFPPNEVDRDMVFVQFTVGLDGTVENVGAVKGKEKAYRLAAERTVRRMPKWRPARMNGHDVRCRLTLPIKFETR